MFLINMPSEQAFVAMRNMLERHCLRAFYGGSGAKDDVRRSFLWSQNLANIIPKGRSVLPVRTLALTCLASSGLVTCNTGYLTPY